MKLNAVSELALTETTDIRACRQAMCYCYCYCYCSGSLQNCQHLITANSTPFRKGNLFARFSKNCMNYHDYRTMRYIYSSLIMQFEHDEHANSGIYTCRCIAELG